MKDGNDMTAERRPVEREFAVPRRIASRDVMPETCLIERRLSRVYDVSADLPQSMASLLRSLDRSGR